MPVINRFAEFHDEIRAWRHDIHANPELSYDVHRTAGLVTDKLHAFGVDEVVTGIGRTGVVGVIKGAQAENGKCIGLRCDLDALPIQEGIERPHGSTVPGRMHACGHDGHTAMLLGAAKYLAETRNFSGNVALIFQPAEEGGAGGKAMVDDGLMDRFGIDEVYGMHNLPGLPPGQFATNPGAVLASAEDICITITGKGGHAAQPHLCIDPIVIGTQVIQALQLLISRVRDPLKPAVISITKFHAGHATNVIPATAELAGTLRTLDTETRELLLPRIIETVKQTADLAGGSAEIGFGDAYPVTRNHPEQAAKACDAAALVAGEERVERNHVPRMGAEDFSFMLRERPGAMIFIGNGDSAGLHHPHYDFNDDIIPAGCSYWVSLVETVLSAGKSG